MDELLKENETLKIENKKIKSENCDYQNKLYYFWFNLSEKVLEKTIVNLKSEITMTHNYHDEKMKLYDNIQERYNNSIIEKDKKIKELEDKYYIFKIDQRKIFEELQQENCNIRTDKEKIIKELQELNIANCKLRTNQLKISKIINI